MKSSTNCAKSGFSLVEALVVLGVVAVLAALLFPVLQNSRRAGMQGKCIANARQLATALIAYRNDHDGLLMPTSPEETGFNGYNPGAIVDTYLGEKGAYIGACLSPVWSCPANPGWEPDIHNNSGASYVVNANLRGYYIGSAVHAGKLLLVMERGTRPLIQPGTAMGGNHYGRATDASSIAGYFGHPAGCTVAFVDGHVESWPITNFLGPDLKGGLANYQPIYWEPEYSE